ncbi:hypothetical protein TAMA11512_17210 [Selenomonas sp. TAMA-11512]|uniref:hypothetical protein n=1 Tax=Selenomonas sp. TAMA-11512 TaxID=3095337 RepID=UPI003092B06D|nr:hypothetical protein TAMA11512_17210 [Selenomonas sp. TAMA-11512]
MYFRAQQYYRINRQLKKSYHDRVRRGEDKEVPALHREINERIVELFVHGGHISHEVAAALGHTHDHGEHALSDGAVE